MDEFIALFGQLLIYLTLLILTVYTLVFSYHWFSYGTSRSASLAALVIFISGATGFFLMLVGVYQFL